MPLAEGENDLAEIRRECSYLIQRVAEQGTLPSSDVTYLVRIIAQLAAEVERLRHPVA